MSAPARGLVVAAFFSVVGPIIVSLFAGVGGALIVLGGFVIKADVPTPLGSVSEFLGAISSILSLAGGMMLGALRAGFGVHGYPALLTGMLVGLLTWRRGRITVVEVVVAAFVVSLLCWGLPRLEAFICSGANVRPECVPARAVQIFKVLGLQVLSFWSVYAVVMLFCRWLLQRLRVLPA